MSSNSQYSFSKDLTLDTLSHQEFFALAYEIGLQLKWNITNISDTSIDFISDLSWSGNNEAINIQVNDNIATISSSFSDNRILNTDINKENIDAFISKFDVLKNTQNIEELVHNYNHYLQTIQVSEQSNVETEKIEDNSSFWDLFLPSDGYFINPIIMDINIIVFLIMAITSLSFLEFDTDTLIHWGGNLKRLTLDGQWWRLFTSCFVHVGFMHLVMNMVALIYMGVYVEAYLGKSRYLATYLFTGVVSSLASLYWNEFSVSVGASGAIFGVYGAFFTLLVLGIVEKSIRRPFIFTIVFFFIISVFEGTTEENIDLAAHIVGFISGIFVGLFFVPSILKPNPFIKIFSLMLLPMLLIFIVIFSLKKIPKDDIIYDSIFSRFGKLETEAIGVYKLPDSTPTDSVLIYLETKGIPNWKENIRLIDSLKYLKLPITLKNQNKYLLEYSKLRLQSFELYYKGIKEQTGLYNYQLDSLYTQIDSALVRIKRAQ